jgi:CubicO group peptidase (beta-lactamase class C family)
MRETGAPGMTLSLANRDGLIRASTYGFADTKAKARVVPETMFEIGSVSKSFVGLALLQLRDEGKLDLNKPVVEYLPWLKISSKFEPITTHHLLSHTAGLPGAPLLLDALLHELWTAYAPGKRFLYSNTGYNILGFLIEALDKRPFADAMRARMLAPLGMTASAPIISNELRGQMATKAVRFRLMAHLPKRSGLKLTSPPEASRLRRLTWRSTCACCSIAARCQKEDSYPKKVLGFSSNRRSTRRIAASPRRMVMACG